MRGAEFEQGGGRERGDMERVRERRGREWGERGRVEKGGSEMRIE